MKKAWVAMAIGALLPLCASEHLRYGARLSLVAPVGVLGRSMNQEVDGLGVAAICNMSNGHTLTIRLDSSFFDAKDSARIELAKKNQLNVDNYLGYCFRDLNLGIDYKVHLNKTQTGSYGLVGMSAERRKTVLSYKDIDKNGNPGNKVKKRTTETNIGYNVGIGYDLNKHLDIQLCYGIHKYDNKTSSKITTAITCIF